VRRCAALLALVAGALLAACGGAGQAQAPLRVLFVGNSLTATNDLPAAVAAVASRSGRRPVEYRTIAPGGVSLEEHWRTTGARALLAGGGWDVVVLQQGPSSLPESQGHLRRWATRWSEEARARGARPALLMVWPETARASAFPAVIASYTRAADAADATLLPVGAAWRAAVRRDPSLGLYGPDGFHPSDLGTSLAALVVYAGLTAVSPASLELDRPVSGEESEAVRRAAVDALAG